MYEECIRCGEAPAVDELGYCGHCHWAVRAELEEGFFQLREYLRSWARFSDWCDDRPVVKHTAGWTPPLARPGSGL